MTAKGIMKLSEDTLNGFIMLDRVAVINVEDNKIIVATDLTEGRQIENIRSKFEFIFGCEVQVDNIKSHPEAREKFLDLVQKGDEQLEESIAKLL